jgi:uncharacterized membrane protein YedE/YeeE
MTEFTPVSALVGGALIGGSAALYLILTGRVAGISGILGGLLLPSSGGRGWRLAFLAGLISAPLAYIAVTNRAPEVEIDASAPVLVVAGLLVGFGSRLGAGCTSGHGVCGIGRGSARSIAATSIFMTTAIATVFVTRHLFGG